MRLAVPLLLVGLLPANGAWAQLPAEAAPEVTVSAPRGQTIGGIAPQGARVSVAATNVFDRRQSVHDASGLTPIAFAPGYLDPPGRVIAITVRKVF
jgi:hypothetical protein